MDINPAPSPPSLNYKLSSFGGGPLPDHGSEYAKYILPLDCTATRMTSQMVIYETTNVVEVYVLDRPSGCCWNDGNAVIGIQNQAGNLGYTPPGRNTGDWDANLRPGVLHPMGLQT